MSRPAPSQFPATRPFGVLVAMGLLLPVFSVSAAFTQISRVSLATGGVEGNGPSVMSAISGDGNFVTFSSTADNLVAGDTNVAEDIFVHDRGAMSTERVSVGAMGEGNGRSHNSVLSHDGRYVAFSSLSTNLVANDLNGFQDVFVRDRMMGTTVRVSVNSAGVEGASFSGRPSISADGRLVTFFSFSSNLVAIDTNNQGDVFLHDRDADSNGTFDEPGGISTTLVSVASDETQANNQSLDSAISADGTTVVFESLASNLVAGDTNGFGDVFVRNLAAGTTERVSVSSAGVQGSSQSFQPKISGDGNLVVFSSSADTLVPGSTASNHIYLRNRTLNQTERLSNSAAGQQGNNASFHPSINTQGTRVSFDSLASNLTGGDANGQFDVFVRTLGATEIHRVEGVADPNGASAAPSISADGGLVAFESTASNLVAGDTNAQSDVFLVPTTGGGGGDPGTPVADAGPDQVVALPHDRRAGGTAAVTVDGSASSDPDGQRLRYAWTSATTGRTGRVARFRDSLPVGVHQITLRVTDPDGKFDEDTVQITVTNKANDAPVADAGDDRTMIARFPTTMVTVPLNGGRSRDPDRDPLTYEWRDISSGPPGTLLGTRRALRIRVGRGDYVIRLTVTDPFGASSTDDVMIHIVPPP